MVLFAFPLAKIEDEPTRVCMIEFRQMLPNEVIDKRKETVDMFNSKTTDDERQEFLNALFNGAEVLHGPNKVLCIKIYLPTIPRTPITEFLYSDILKITEEVQNLPLKEWRRGDVERWAKEFYC